MDMGQPDAGPNQTH